MTDLDKQSVAEIFWDGCRVGELRYERCSRCAIAQTYPRGFCTSCGSRETIWERSDRCGVVYSATRVLRASDPAFQTIAPYALFLVSIDEGFRIMAHGDADLGVGARVHVDFHDVAGRTLPYLRLDERGEQAHNGRQNELS
jgi:uncharacterized OB-fold protein